MKNKKTIAIAASFIGASLLAGNSFALGSATNFNIINDATQRTQTIRGQAYTSNITFTHRQETAQASGIENPDTFDAMPVIFGVSIACVVFAAAFIFSKSRRRSNIGKGFFAFVLGVAVLSGVFGGVSYAAPTDEEDGSDAQTFTVTDAGLYRALRNCSTGVYEGTSKTASNSEGGSGHKGGGDTDLISNPTCFYDEPAIAFDDATQTITMNPNALVSLDASGLGIRSIAEITKFKNLENLDLSNNNIVDVSMLTAENFEWLGRVNLNNNNITSLKGLDLNLLQGPSAYFTQSINVEYGENGVAELPSLIIELADLIDDAGTVDNDGNCFKLPIHTYNLTIANDLSSVSVVDSSKAAYISMSEDEIMEALEDFYDNVSVHIAP